MQSISCPANNEGPSVCLAGFSLIEAAIVLGVVGLVIGGIWVAASAVQEGMRLNKAIQALTVISSKATTVFGPADIEALGTQYYNIESVMIDMGAVPADMAQNGSIIDPWGRPMVVRLVGADITSSMPRIGIEFTDVPVSTCKNLIARLPRAGFIGVWVTRPTTTYYTSLPIDFNGPVCSELQPRLAIDFAFSKP